jgi:hypothetical protein
MTWHSILAFPQNMFTDDNGSELYPAPGVAQYVPQINMEIRPLQQDRYGRQWSTNFVQVLTQLSLVLHYRGQWSFSLN